MLLQLWWGHPSHEEEKRAMPSLLGLTTDLGHLGRDVDFGDSARMPAVVALLGPSRAGFVLWPRQGEHAPCSAVHHCGACSW